MTKYMGKSPQSLTKMSARNITKENVSETRNLFMEECMTLNGFTATFEAL
jgi:hypothetical protein